MLMSEREREMQNDWFQQGLEQGIEQGSEQTLVSKIRKKLAKGKPFSVIVEELEETEARICELIEKYQIKATVE